MVHKLSKSQDHKFGGDWELLFQYHLVKFEGVGGKCNLVLLLWFHTSDISTENAIKLLMAWVFFFFFFFLCGLDAGVFLFVFGVLFLCFSPSKKKKWQALNLYLLGKKFF